MQFEIDYYDKLYLFLQGSDNIVYNVCDLADNQEKFINYIRLYQHIRTPDEADVQISIDAKQIYVVEFFQNKLNAQVTESLMSTMYVKQLQQIAATPLTQSIEPVQQGYVQQFASQPIKKSPFNS